MAQLRITVGTLRTALKDVNEARYDHPSDKKLKQKEWQGLAPKEFPEPKSDVGFKGREAPPEIEKPEISDEEREEKIAAFAAKKAARKAEDERKAAAEARLEDETGSSPEVSASADSPEVKEKFVPQASVPSEFMALLPSSYKPAIVRAPTTKEREERRKNNQPELTPIILRNASVLSPEIQAKWRQLAADYEKRTGKKAPTPQQAGEAKDEFQQEKLQSIYKDMKPAAKPQSAGAAHVIKQRPEKPAITKDYVGKSVQAPYLKGKTGESGEKSMGNAKAAPDIKELKINFDQLEKISKKAYDEFPPGDWAGIFMRAGHLFIKPDNPGQKPLVWSNVPPRGQQPGKKHAWRSLEELTAQQVQALGFFDTTQRGNPRKNVPVKSELPFDNPVGQSYDEEKDPNGVRFKGGAGGRVETQTTASTPGSVTGPGGIPTKQAIKDTETASQAQTSEIPDWDTFDEQKLKRALELAIKKFGDKNQFVEDIRASLVDRQTGTPPSQPLKTQLPRKFQTKKIRDIFRSYESGDNVLAIRQLSLLPSDVRGAVKAYMHDVFGPIEGI